MSDAIEVISTGKDLGQLRLQVHAQPGAKRTELMGLHGDAVKIRVQAPPVDGRANDELVEFISETLGIARSQVKLVRGEKSRAKTFQITGIELADARRLLLKI